MTLKPFYEQSGITIYHGDCRVIVPELFQKPSKKVLVLGDPPFGTGVKNQGRADRQAARHGKSRVNRCRPKARAWLPCDGNDAPFDPSPWLAWPRLVLWGANHYADKLPASPSYLVWDKREGGGSDNSADCELAWSNLGGPARLIHHLWRGTCRASETGEEHLHPMQKPVSLSLWVLGGAGVPARGVKPGDTVLVPWLGAGGDLVAVRALQATIPGLTAIGIDTEELYCGIAASRIRQNVLPLHGGSRA